MKRVIKLTESDLTRIVKRVMNEQVTGSITKLGSELANVPEDIKKGFATGCYTVKSGDIIGTIAKKFGVSVDDINKLNGLTNSDIKPGQKLRVKNTTNFKGC
jgi:LysM repeat protein